MDDDMIPAKGRSPNGWHRYWTQERTLEGLRAMLADISERGVAPPTSVAAYKELKRGHPEYPPPRHVTGYWGTLAGAWAAVGIKVTPGFAPWSDADVRKLRKAVQRGKTVAQIAKQLGRTEAGVRNRLHVLGIDAEAGDITAVEVARRFDAPLTRVTAAIERGLLPARRPKGSRGYRIAPADADKLAEYFTAPKRS